MKINPKIILLAAGFFLAGFVTRSWLTPQRLPEPPPATTAVTPFAMLTPLTVSTQVFHIDDGAWYIWPDGRRTVPQPMSSEEMRRARPGYYDLLDAQSRPDIDLRDSK